MHEINKMLWDLLAGIALGWESTCGTKVMHRNEQLAQKHADQINDGTRRDREPYACVWCWQWHVGRRIKRSHIIRLRYTVINSQRGGRT